MSLYEAREVMMRLKEPEDGRDQVSKIVALRVVSHAHRVFR